SIQASSDITSQADKANLQVEVNQLLLEVNRISQNTNFNGQQLLDGSHAGFQGAVSASLQITANSVLATAGSGAIPNGGVLVASAVAANANFFTTSGATGTTDGSIELQVVNTGTAIVAQSYGISSATGVVTVLGSAVAGGTITVDNVLLTVGNITIADVGVTSFVKVSQSVGLASNPTKAAFNFQSGAVEGATIQVGFQATSTATLRIANINLLASSPQSASLGAEDAIGQIDNALQTLLNQRATLGAVIVRLNEDAANDNIAAVNLQASESQIRDLNVGQATTEFTKRQILVQVGTSVLAQSNSNAQSVLGLFR
ncbi:MAG: hypothetical protein M3N19_01075, partial [Candidatus Eremiobacteraeota bacterium]|nr:hypothetical protein [Candidatus Eremiobacteraeota bacterium]